MTDIPGRELSFRAEAAGDRVLVSVTDAQTGIALRPNLSADQARGIADLLRVCAAAAAGAGAQTAGAPTTEVGIMRRGSGLALTVRSGIVTVELPLSVLQASVLVERLRDQFETVVRDELPD